MRSTVGVVLLVVLRAASGAALGRVLVVGARSTEHALSPSDTPRDAQTLRQTLSRLRREREWDVAHSLLWEQLQEQPELVEPVHCNIVLSSLSEAPRRPEWERALVLLEHMPTAGRTPDAYTYSAAISACARGGQSEHAVNTFKAMCASDVPPNDVVYNNVLSACQRAQQHKTLLALFATMLIRGVAPDAWACSAAIGARDKDGDHQGALDMFDTLTRPQRSVHTYAAAMLAAKHAERPAKAVSLYEEMLERGIVPPSHTPSATPTAPSQTAPSQTGRLRYDYCRKRREWRSTCSALTLRFVHALQAAGGGMRWRCWRSSRGAGSSPPSTASPAPSPRRNRTDGGGRPLSSSSE